MPRNIYRIVYDGVVYFVIARSFATAIDLWEAHARAEWKEDYDGTEASESCALVHDGPIIGEYSPPMAS